MPGCESTPEPADHEEVSASTPFKWPTFDEAIDAARVSGKPILIDIYAPWCGWCQKMQEEVYGNPTLAGYVREKFEYGRLNIDDSQTRHQFKEYNLTSQELGYAFGAQGTPTTVFLEHNGDYITHLGGYQDLQSFGHAVQYIGSLSYRTQTYPDYPGGP